ncbi:MAG TPA: D-alanyl-D-alanine carboxypeptidase [Dehalococcoidia bacterium]|nr:D-alanyl-D-alanine carboxypeptidase [Dehalococcoidia bacterium]
MYSYERRSSISPLFIAVPAVILLFLGVFQSVRGLPAIEATTTLAPQATVGSVSPLPLPATGASIVSVTGLGTLAASGAPAPRPIASITKVMTAWVILKYHPLRPGEPGPTITTTAADASRYLQMLAQDQSVLPVAAGMSFTQLELLQGLLVPSANNFAEILAVWDAGSVQAFVQKMNAEARALGMASTTYADPSGFSSGSVSTPQDQLVLARAAMQNPVFAQIVAMPSVRLPGIGLVNAVNQLIGQDGVVGIKTGFTEEAGGNLLFVARRQVGGQQVEVIGAVMGQADRPAAFEATRRILAALGQGLQFARVVASGQPVATLDPEWSGPVDVVVAEDVQMLLWPGMTLEASVELNQVRGGMRAGTEVGTLVLRLGEQERRVPLTLARDLPKAGVLWRLTRT